MSAEHEIVFGEDAGLFEVMATMRAMRRLKPDPVPRELLIRLVEAATWAPSGSNTQDYSYVIVTDREQIWRIGESWQAVVDFYEHVSVKASTMDDATYARLVKAVRYQAEHFAETPALIVACYDMGEWRRRTQRNLIGAAKGARAVGAKRMAGIIRHSVRAESLSEAASVYPGVQNLLLAARGLGLGAVVTTWHLMLEHEFKEILGIPRNVKTFAIIPVGWPKGRFGPVVRRPAADAIRWDRW